MKIVSSQPTSALRQTIRAYPVIAPAYVTPSRHTYHTVAILQRKWAVTLADDNNTIVKAEIWADVPMAIDPTADPYSHLREDRMKIVPPIHEENLKEGEFFSYMDCYVAYGHANIIRQ